MPLPSGRTSRYANRIAWAVTHMAQALLLERPQRGITQITSRGRDVLAKHPDRVDMGVLAQFPEYVEFRSRSGRQPRKEPSGRPAPEVPTEHLSPNEAITEVIDEAHSTVAGDLLARILARPPQFLERLILKLLVSMGYGGLEAATEHLGGPGTKGLTGSSAKTCSALMWSMCRPSATPPTARSVGLTFRGSWGAAWRTDVPRHLHHYKRLQRGCEDLCRTGQRPHRPYRRPRAGPADGEAQLRGQGGGDVRTQGSGRGLLRRELVP